MSVTYKPINWGRQKKIYDGTLAILLLTFAGIFIGLTLAISPTVTVETLILRASAASAFLLLHVILAIGPLARLDSRFAPLLYNRRHLGVTMFFLGALHAVFAVVQFHSGGNRPPLVSAFTAYAREYFILGKGGNPADFPFEIFGAAALAILFLMAATSHDFWLKNLGSGLWKSLHLLVYLAYGLLLVHVFYGALQYERHGGYVLLLGLGFTILVSLHLLAARKEIRVDRSIGQVPSESADSLRDFVRACRSDELQEGRGKTLVAGEERVAIFLNQGKVFAVGNVCRHQGGPLAEGRILNGCITCPWHGWEYRPEDGCSPPPFKEIVPTYDVRVEKGEVFVRSRANARGQRCEGADAGTTPSAPPDPADDFYVGYNASAPAPHARRIRQVVAGLAFVVPALAVAVSVLQQPFGKGAFEYATPRTFEGVFELQPVPQLTLSGLSGGSANSAELEGQTPATFLLAGRGKHGIPGELAELDGHHVQLEGKRIRRDGLAMLEVQATGIRSLGGPETFKAPARDAGKASTILVGELIDLKCFLGVMNPGEGKVHRGCAVRCLSGGVPAGILVRSGDGIEFVGVLSTESDPRVRIDPQWAGRAIEAEGRLGDEGELPVLHLSSIRLASAENTDAELSPTEQAVASTELSRTPD